MQIETIDLVTPMPRTIFRFEALERRILLTILAIDATAGVPFDGMVATDLHLPAYATGPKLMNVRINNQWVYEPTAVLQEDGTYDLYAKLTPQTAGTGEMVISFRNDNTGGWDDLESGPVTVKDNHFSATVPDNYIYNRVAGAQFREPVAIFTTSSATHDDLHDYVVEINWFGKQKTGRLERQADGTVAVYANDAYVPINGGGDDGVGVTIKLDDAVAGYARVSVTGGQSIGFGFFWGSINDEREFSIELPSKPVIQGMPYHYWVPATELEDWDSEFTVEVTWQKSDDEIGKSTATVVRNSDGSHSIVGTMPDGVDTDNGMIRVKEFVNRPAVDGEPAQTYEVEYVGSFMFGSPDEPAPPSEEPVGEEPELPDDGEVVVLPGTVDPSSDDGVDGEVTTVQIMWNDNDAARFDSIADGMFSAADDQLLGEQSEVDVAALVG